MKIRAFCWLAALVVPILFCRNGYPIDDEHSRDSLRGLTGIALVVEPPTKEVEQDGLTLPFIRASAEVFSLAWATQRLRPKSCEKKFGNIRNMGWLSRENN
jgi:hypothetical protein